MHGHASYIHKAWCSDMDPCFWQLPQAGLIMRSRSQPSELAAKQEREGSEQG